MTRFVERPRQKPSISHAAQYIPGESLDDLRQVAWKYGSDAEIAEIPQFVAAVVRYTNYPDNHPSYTDYEVIPADHYLVYSENYGLLYVSDAEAFAREHREMG